jgi:hypothetical protein
LSNPPRASTLDGVGNDLRGNEPAEGDVVDRSIWNQPVAEREQRALLRKSR